MLTKDPKSPTDTDKYAGLKLKCLRLERGISQRELASRVRVTFQQIQKYEKGVNRISVGTLYDICTALGVKPAEFYEDFFQKPKIAESDLSVVDNQVMVELSFLDEVQKNKVLQYIKRLSTKNMLKKENSNAPT